MAARSPPTGVSPRRRSPSSAHFFPRSTPWTAHSALPGGDFVYDGLDTLLERTQRIWRFLPTDHARRLVRAYGTRVDRVLGQAKGLDDLGMRFGADLTAAEVRYLMTAEWAQTADDVLWRRSKLGLRFSPPQTALLEGFMARAAAPALARSPKNFTNLTNRKFIGLWHTSRWGIGF